MKRRFSPDGSEARVWIPQYDSTGQVRAALTVCHAKDAQRWAEAGYQVLATPSDVLAIVTAREDQPLIFAPPRHSAGHGG